MTDEQKTASPQLSRIGVPSDEDLAAVMPSAARMARGPVAIIECFQHIPCNPCAEACTVGAIKPFVNICDLPTIDHDVCTGCGMCVVRCPGLAIFVVDTSKPGDYATLKLPYEYLPLPAAGDEVACLNRLGEEVCRGTVTAAQRPRAFDRTALITVRVPKADATLVRGIRVSPERSPAE